MEENRDINVEPVSLAQFRWEARKRKVVGFFKELPGKTIDFVGQHKEGVAAAVPTMIFVGKKLTKAYGDHKEQVRKDTSVYDFKLHRWCYLKRKMRPEEEREYKRRLASGETVYDILNTMRILKY